MTSATVLHHPQSPTSAEQQPNSVIVVGETASAATSLTSSTNSSDSAPGAESSSSSSSSSSGLGGPSKKSRRRRTSETLLSTASVILRMLGVSSTSSNTPASSKIREEKQPDKVMPAMPRVKSSSISETDYDEMQEQMYEAKSKQHQSVEGVPTATAAKTTNPTSTSAVTSEVSRQSTSAKPKCGVQKSRSANDFRFGKTIGEGSFSTVYLAKDIHTLKEYAIKVCDKHHIVREGKQEYIKRERELMAVMSGCRGFVNLFCTFQDSKSLYFVMTYATNGDLLPHINKVGSFDNACTKFYAAELVLALENMHKRGVIHRDLKPENVLLNSQMHTLIADFGSAKMIEADVSRPDMASEPEAKKFSETENSHPRLGQNSRYQRGRKNSFVGTAQYVSPEILKGQASTAANDLWALGCIIYQMVSGLPPFRGGSEYLIFQSILKKEMSYPEGFDPVARDLVEKLLVLEPSERIGAKDQNRYESIRSHPFFAGIDWTNLHEQEPPKIYPHLPGLEQNELPPVYCVPDHLEPGLGEKQLTRLLGLDLGTPSESVEQPLIVTEQLEAEEATKKKSLAPKSIADVSEAEKTVRLEKQKTDKWNAFAEGELILKQGFVNKRKGLFARKRMLLLTTGPRLIYIDPAQMVKRGEIPWSEELRVEPKNFKIFFVHTPNRTYYLEDPDGFALRWCDAIKDVRGFTYGGEAAESTTTTSGDRVTDYRYSSS